MPEFLEDIKDRYYVARSEGILRDRDIAPSFTDEIEDDFWPSNMYEASRTLTKCSDERISNYGMILSKAYREFLGTLSSQEVAEFEEREGILAEIDNSYQDALETGLINEEMWKTVNDYFDGVHQLEETSPQQKGEIITELIDNQEL